MGVCPALCDGIQTRVFARFEHRVETVNAVVRAGATTTADGDRSAEVTAVGLVGRGRNDVLAHGEGNIGNRGHVKVQAQKLACMERREIVCLVLSRTT
jgi:hypothetical protein